VTPSGNKPATFRLVAQFPRLSTGCPCLYFRLNSFRLYILSFLSFIWINSVALLIFCVLIFLQCRNTGKASFLPQFQPQSSRMWSMLRIQHRIKCFVPKANLFLFCCGSATQRGSCPPHSWGFLDHTQRRTTVGRTSLDEWSALRRDLYLTTHNTHNRLTTMSPGGIRTHDLSRREVADLHLRPSGHLDRHRRQLPARNIRPS